MFAGKKKPLDFNDHEIKRLDWNGRPQKGEEFLRESEFLNFFPGLQAKTQLMSLATILSTAARAGVSSGRSRRVLPWASNCCSVES